MCSLFVYIVASRKNGPTYAGLTLDLVHRVWQHRSGQMDLQGAPVGCAQLVWYASFDQAEEARIQLDRLSRWPEAWTARLIEEANPDWRDLWASLDGQPTIGISHAFATYNAGTSSPYPVIRPMLKVA